MVTKIGHTVLYRTGRYINIQPFYKIYFSLYKNRNWTHRKFDSSVPRVWSDQRMEDWIDSNLLVSVERTCKLNLLGLMDPGTDIPSRLHTPPLPLSLTGFSYNLLHWIRTAVLRCLSAAPFPSHLDSYPEQIHIYEIKGLRTALSC